VRSDFLKTVDVLVDAGAHLDYSVHGFTAVLTAATRGSAAMVAKLIDRGCDLEMKCKDGFTALYRACGGGYTDCVQLLLDARSNPDCASRAGWTPLLFAAWQGRGEVVRLLVDHGANREMQAEKGDTALNLACARGHVRVVQVLLRKGQRANLESTNAEGNTPLLSAAKNGKLDCVRVLLRVGCRLEPMDKYGNTALILTSRFFNGNGVRIMLMWGAHIDHRNNVGTTALMTAAKRKDWSTVDLLLIQGRADVGLVNKKGKSVLSYLLQGAEDALIRRKLAFLVLCACKDMDPVECVKVDLVSLFAALSTALNHYKDVMEHVAASFEYLRAALVDAQAVPAPAMECVAGYLGMTTTEDRVNVMLDRKGDVCQSHMTTDDRRAFEFWFYKHHLHERSRTAAASAAAVREAHTTLAAPAAAQGPTEPQLPPCDNQGCGKAGNKRCGRCKTVMYCSVGCQREGWSSHRFSCKKN
jgi:ankyrin repeat protein